MRRKNENLFALQKKKSDSCYSFIIMGSSLQSLLRHSPYLKHRHLCLGKELQDKGQYLNWNLLMLA